MGGPWLYVVFHLHIRQHLLVVFIEHHHKAHLNALNNNILRLHLH